MGLETRRRHSRIEIRGRMRDSTEAYEVIQRMRVLCEAASDRLDAENKEIFA